MKFNINKKVLKEKTELSYFMQRLYNQKLTTTSGGNLSLKLDHTLILITISGTDKGRISPDEIAEISLSGEVLKIKKNLSVSIESKMHLAIYRVRPDVSAIVHAHPPIASALSASTLKIKNNLIAESYAILGEIGYAAYKLMGSEDLASEVAKIAKDHNTIVMQNHGAIALGESLLQAFDRLEVLENAAYMTLIHEYLLKNFSTPLSDNQLLAISQLILKTKSKKTSNV